MAGISAEIPALLILKCKTELISDKRRRLMALQKAEEVQRRNETDDE